MPTTRREALQATLAMAAASACNWRRLGRPNILFIMTDDHAAGHSGCYGNKIIKTPNLDRLAAEGTRFDSSFVTNSLCAPSRACVLTGAYSHVNGIRGNSEAKNAIEKIDPNVPAYPQLLKAAGYRTGIAGKWHLSHDPVGFDSWAVLPGQGEYFNPTFIENGTRKQHQGYATDITTDFALEFLKQQDASKPWCLVYQHKAPHRPFLPPPRFAKTFEKIEIPEPPTFDDDYATRKVAAEAEDMRFDISLEPDYKKEMPTGLDAKAKKKWIYQRFVKDYYGAIMAIDENLGRVLKHLDDRKMTEDTLIVYTSDNGFFVGDHGWYDKRFMYEPSLRVPMIVRAPGARRGATHELMTLNIDIAPTILDYAGIPQPETMQGASFRRLLAGAAPVEWRKSMYYTYYENSWALAGKGKEAMSDPSFQFFTPHRIGPHRGVRTTTHKLIQYYAEQDYWELFNLEDDPHELRNLYGKPGNESVTAALKLELERLRGQYKDAA